jgi:glutamate---cysteine ligase / carboxylate-amine ligase
MIRAVVDDLTGGALPGWAEWTPSRPYTVGIEEEVMIVEPRTGALAAGFTLDDLPEDLIDNLHDETQQAVAELQTSAYADVAGAVDHLVRLRLALAEYLWDRGLAAAGAGTHPLTVWTEVRVSEASRYRAIHETMRELARREPTFALHVHIGVDTPERGLLLANRMRAHVPLLLALSANSPFWQGRDTGLHSMRVPLFQAFPRAGLPRAFPTYEGYVTAIDQLVRCGAIPEPTFLWWDIRLQPRFGTVEVRIMDTQITVDATAALVGFVQAVGHLELEGDDRANRLDASPEVLDENRFLACRDGMSACLIDLETDRLVPAEDLLAGLLERARDHAEDLGCADALQAVSELARDTGAVWQRRVAGAVGPEGLVARLAARFTEGLLDGPGSILDG